MTPQQQGNARSAIARRLFAISLATLVALALFTWRCTEPLPQNSLQVTPASKTRVLDRAGNPLSITYQNTWNLNDQRNLSELPPLLIHAFISAEDRRFYEHNGVDWRARFAAIVQSARSGHIVRGASTITEQVVRMLHPRARTIWSRWVEGWEANALERRFSKAEILQFYLNQVPFDDQRRGVAQAAQLYFGRDVSTLNRREMLALAVSVRSPQHLDPRHPTANLERDIAALLPTLHQHGWLSGDIEPQFSATNASIISPDVSHFVSFVIRRAETQTSITTTLDPNLQFAVQKLLQVRLDELKKRDVGSAAALVVDHQSHEILVWVSLSDAATNAIDAVVTPRQPGSAIKPLLYAAAFDRGLSATSLLEDAPLEDAVGNGLHRYRNYSRRYYGQVTPRIALANSLNTPAVRLLQDQVGVSNFLTLLHQLDVNSLHESPHFYGEGLALGNGELTLFELVQAYSALAEQGQFAPLLWQHGDLTIAAKPVFSFESTSLISDILSDNTARRLEFGAGDILHFPVQTAVKTGTSTDYRDAWAIGYNARYLVGIWMGNLDRRPMQEITGSAGPAVVLRSVMGELLQRDKTIGPLAMSPALTKQTVCLPTPGDNRPCVDREEWVSNQNKQTQTQKTATIRPWIARPTEGLEIARDPRVPTDQQAFSFQLAGLNKTAEIHWQVDNKSLSYCNGINCTWPLAPGAHQVKAEIIEPGNEALQLAPVNFIVH